MNEDSEDETGGQPGDDFATTVEVEAALKGAMGDKDVRHRLAVGANVLLSRHQRLAATVTWEDLLQGALTAILAGKRKWPKNRLDFVGLVFGTMKSQASNQSRILANTTVQAVPESSLARSDDVSGESPIDRIAGETPGPEQAYSRKEEEARDEADLASLRAQLKPAAQQVFDLMLAGSTKKEIRTALGMSEKDYWSADRQVGRGLSALATRRKAE